MMSDLSAIIASILPVNQGDLITSEYINNLRSAIVALGSVGAGGSAGETGVRITPRFQNYSDSGAWVSIDLGQVQKPGNQDNAKGWMQIQLPNKLTIQSLQVFGNVRGGNPPFPSANATL